MDNLGFYIALFAHLIGLIIGFGAVMVIDAFGALWLFKKLNIELPLVRRVADITQRLIWIGFSILVVSGIVMLLMKGSVSDLAKIKLVLVGLVGLNGIFLHYIKKAMDNLGQNAREVPSKIMFRIGLATGISQLGWWGATLIGFYNRHIGDPLGFAEFYLPISGLIIFLIGITWTIGEVITSRQPRP
jgi:hypothetical protein